MFWLQSEATTLKLFFPKLLGRSPDNPDLPEFFEDFEQDFELSLVQKSEILDKNLSQTSKIDQILFNQTET